MNQPRGYGCGVRNKEKERILEFWAAINTSAGNTLFRKKTSNLLACEPGPSKTQVDYCLIRRNQRKFLKDIKVLSSEEYITQHNPLICDFKIRKVKDTRRKFVPKKRIQKLREESVKVEFRWYINKYRANSQKDVSFEGCWNLLKDPLQEATKRCCEWTNGPARCKRNIVVEWFY